MVRTLIGGRLRTSTLALVVIFAGILALYFIVRPAPTTSTTNNNPPASPSPAPTHSLRPLPTHS